jgi:hypothetical protein
MTAGYGLIDLWLTGREVAGDRLPHSSARVRGYPQCSPADGSSEAVSADNLLTPNAGTGSVVTHEPGSDLRLLW